MTKWYVALLIAALTSAFFAGVYYTESQVVVKEVKGETQIVIRDRIVTHTIVKAPDGTSTETTTTTEHDQTQTETTTASESTNETGGSSGYGKGYSVGAGYWMGSGRDLIDGWRNSQVSVDVGRRIVGPLWLDVAARPFGEKKEVMAGVRIEW